MKTRLVTHSILQIAEEIIPKFPIDIDILVQRYIKAYGNTIQADVANFSGKLLEFQLHIILENLCRAFPEDIKIETLETKRTGGGYKLVQHNPHTYNIHAATREGGHAGEYDAITKIKNPCVPFLKGDQKLIVVWDSKLGIYNHKIDGFFEPIRKCYRRSCFSYVLLVLDEPSLNDYTKWNLLLLKKLGAIVISLPMTKDIYIQNALKAGREYNLIKE